MAAIICDLSGRVAAAIDRASDFKEPFMRLTFALLTLLTLSACGVPFVPLI
ncbi:hypothetical protein [Paracoccus beibuensis]|uniref:hypothetical protein n=1 Tax=Paracoccus beibuensis TaxID=547602 RepID=UPI00223EF4F7|nr:hypothetical protein [Paracoccus beibuensis]